MMMRNNIRFRLLIKKILQNKLVCGVLGAIVMLSAKLSHAGADSEYLQYCSSDIFRKKYEEADCWSCNVVLSLMQSMTKTIEDIYIALREVSLTALLYFGAIWVAAYFIKSFGSFAAQDTAKTMDGLLNFFFKWALCYVLIYTGIDTIVEFVVAPLLDIGYSIGIGFNESSSIL